MSRRSPTIARLVTGFESLRADDCDALGAFYRTDAHFKDPFNDVVGRTDIVAIYRHMFVQVDDPRFRITTVIETPEPDAPESVRVPVEAVLFWQFRFRLRRAAWHPGQASTHCIVGATHLSFDETGLIRTHRDYWDAAEELYETFPLLGPVMRWLRRRVAAPVAGRSRGRRPEPPAPDQPPDIGSAPNRRNSSP